MGLLAILDTLVILLVMLLLICAPFYITDTIESLTKGSSKHFKCFKYSVMFIALCLYCYFHQLSLQRPLQKMEFFKNEDLFAYYFMYCAIASFITCLLIDTGILKTKKQNQRTTSSPNAEIDKDAFLKPETKEHKKKMEQMRPLCTNCGKTNSPDAKLCMHCFKELPNYKTKILSEEEERLKAEIKAELLKSIDKT